MGEMDEVVNEFLVESFENLDRLDRDFVALETDPEDAPTIASIFRTIHTIKGTCGFLGFSKLESVAHVGENLLCSLRDKQLTINTEITTGLLKLVDVVREILGFIQSTQTEGDKEYSSIVALLKDLNESKPGQPDLVYEEHKVEPEKPAAEIIPAVAAAAAVAATPEKAKVVASIEPAHAPEEKENAASKESHSAGPGNAIRVDVGLLDKLMNLVGELVLARNQVLQHTANIENTALLNSTQRLNLITSELQESVMKTRMQPIGGLWNKFPRVVRDLSQSCGKKVRIEMEGRETELDKTILEAIKDPLTHIIRNSVDHGVEAPDVRVAKGKPEEGCLYMRAYHEGGQVNIEIKDDGNGIDPERVKRKALEKGLITSEAAARMTDREAITLIFLPGFSTAEKVTNVSGRGVGMDVVKTNVEKIGGTVDVSSKLGEGTNLRVKIPLTLAIIPALIVSTAGERFAIPQVSLLELVRLEGSDAKIEHIHGTPIYRLRGKLLPLVHLHQILQIEPVARTDKTKQVSNIVVLRSGDHQFGLVVDQVNDTEEIVVKPLGKQLKGISMFAGATIMGDGRVALILDVMGLAAKSNVQGGNPEQQQAADVVRSDADGIESLLLFTMADNQRGALPLNRVSRLEEFKESSIEDSGDMAVVQYRGQIMPLINLASVIRDRRKKPRVEEPTANQPKSQKIQVVVFSHENRDIGLQVDRIVDVVEERVVLQPAGARPGVRGTAVIKEKVTEVVDLNAVLNAARNMHVDQAA